MFNVVFPNSVTIEQYMKYYAQNPGIKAIIIRNLKMFTNKSMMVINYEN